MSPSRTLTMAMGSSQRSEYISTGKSWQLALHLQVPSLPRNPSHLASRLPVEAVTVWDEKLI